jgi:predicted amino acid dehydrogenase
MNRFGFIVHPISESHLAQIMRRVLQSSDSSVRGEALTVGQGSNCLITQAFQFQFDGLGKGAECLGIVCPLTPSEMVSDQPLAVIKILEAINIAKDWGAKLVGLGGFTSIIGSSGIEVADRSPLPVTSGNTCTVVAIVGAVDKASSLLDIDVERSTLAIVGATGDIGSACARSLIDRFDSIILVARNEERLYLLAEELRTSSKKRIEIERRPGAAAQKADVLITATSAHTTLIEPHDLKPGSIVCDASYPANVSREVRSSRKDVLVFEGGMMCWSELFSQVPANHPFWMFNLPIGVHGCFAETILLNMEDKFITYTIGRGNITPNNLTEMRGFVNKYGFHPADFWHGSGAYTKAELERIRKARPAIIGQSADHPDRVPSR